MVNRKRDRQHGGDHTVKLYPVTSYLITPIKKKKTRADAAVEAQTSFFSGLLCLIRTLAV